MVTLQPAALLCIKTLHDRKTSTVPGTILHVRIVTFLWLVVVLHTQCGH